MPNHVTNRQLAFILFMTLTAITINSIPKTTVEDIGTDGWVTLILTSIVFGILVVVIVKLHNMYPDKVLYDYSKEIVGKLVTVLIVIYYILYFLSVDIFLHFSISNVLKSNFLIRTPRGVILFLSIAVCGYGAYKGVRNIARLFEIYGVVFLFSILVTHTMMLFQGEFKYILPLYNPASTKTYFIAIKDTLFPFLGIEVLTVIPFSKQKNKKASLVAFFTLLGIGVIYSLIVLTSIMMVGKYDIIHYHYAMLTAIRQIKIPIFEFLARMDIIFLIVGLMSVHASMMIVYVVTVEYLQKLFAKINRVIIVLAVGLLVLIGSLIVLEIQHYEKAYLILIKYLGTLAAAIIPIFLFIIAKVKKRVKKVS